MKHILQVIFAFVFTINFSSAFSQTTFYAVASGNWNGSGIWSDDGINPIVCSPCVAGTHFPGATNDAYTNGQSITVNGFIGGATCRNLFVDVYTVNSLIVSANLTVTGSMVGWDSNTFYFGGPTVSLISGNANIFFTAANYDGIGFQLFNNEVISYWNSNAPIPRAVFNLPMGTTYTIDNDGLGSLAINTMVVTGNSSLATSYFNFGSSSPEVGLEVANSLTIPTPAASFISSVPIRQNSTATSRIPNASINGSLTASSYFNVQNLSLGSSGTLITEYTGVDQTQGWWYQGNAPGGSFAPTSTVIYNAAIDQNVFARPYGNLVFNGSGTKTVVNSAGLNVQGSLSILSSSVTLNAVAATGISIGGSLTNDGNWSPLQLITFSGVNSGIIGGSQSTTFNGGITINKSTGTLTMATATNINTNISNGIAITSGTLDLGNVNTTLNGGNVSNGGAITSGTSGNLIIQGATEFSGTGIYALRNLTVQNTGDATFLQDVSFAGNIVNNGSLAFSNSIDVTFNGTGAQAISGNAFSVFDMSVVKGSSTLSNNGTVNLLGTLTITNGTFDADGTGSGTFILNSDSNGDARIGPMAGGSIVDNVTFERYFNNTVTNRYRNFAFPVNGVSVETLGSFFTIVDGSFAWYQESVLGDYDQGWQIQNSGGLANGRAYTAGMYNEQPITISVVGPLFKGLPTDELSPHNYNLSYTDDPGQPASQDGWNFVANPYASPIDWTAASGWTKSGGIDATASIWDAVGGAYRVSGTSWDGVVASGQSFWVHTTAAATLHSTEAVKVNVADPNFYRKRTTVPEDRLLVKLEDDKSFDIAAIQYTDKATPQYDGAFDAYKLPNRIFNLSSLTPEDEDLAVNALPRSFCTNRLRLNITNIDPGAYKLSFESLASFRNLDSLVLFDNFLEKSVTVTEGMVYGFEVTAKSASYGAGRFELQFNFPDVGAIVPEITLDNRTLVSSFESGNQWLLDGEIIPGETGASILPLTSGNYQVTVTDGGCSVTSPAFAMERIPSRIHPNPATTHFEIDLSGVLNGDVTKAGTIYLYSATGQLILQERFTGIDRDMSVKLNGVKSGEYIVNVVREDSKIVAKERLIIK